ncbi:MAG TPA: response regulator [Azospirillaceae bacterium]|nr:response regulator [Azospirillaceae bacterium]
MTPERSQPAATPDSAPAAHILIVEDEALVAMIMVDVVEETGCRVVGPADGLGMAIEFARTEPKLDGAILDLNLNGTHAYPVAEILKQRGVPFVFVTGYGSNELAPPYDGHPSITKPFRIEEIEDAVRRMLARDTA